MKVLIVAALLGCVGCGADQVPTTPTRVQPPPTISAEAIKSIQPEIIRAAVQEFNSCPDGEVVVLNANTREGRVTLTWKAVPNVDEYFIYIERNNRTSYEIETEGRPIDNGILEITWGAGDGSYKGRIQTVNRCGIAGVWGPWVTWEIDEDGTNQGSTGGDGQDSPGETPPGSGGGGSTPPNPPGNGGGSGTGGGSKPPKECKNGNSGDHNNDGHPDCGRDK